MYTTKIYLKSDAPAFTSKQINELLSQGVDSIVTSTLIKEELNGDVRDGIDGGCYGARDGKTYEGVTVYMDALEVESEGNIAAALLDEFHYTKVEDEFVDAFETDNVGNTYNFENLEIDNHVDYKIINDIVFVKFHLGGDIRGNYSDWYALACDQEDFFSIVLSFEQQDEEEEIA